jgi:hypothetical protein
MVEIRRKGSNAEVIRNRYGVGNSGYSGHEVRESARPLHHTTTIYETAHMPLPKPYTSLLNRGLSPNHFAYNGAKGGRR